MMRVRVYLMILMMIVVKIKARTFGSFEVSALKQTCKFTSAAVVAAVVVARNLSVIVGAVL